MQPRDCNRQSINLTTHSASTWADFAAIGRIAGFVRCSASRRNDQFVADLEADEAGRRTVVRLCQLFQRDTSSDGDGVCIVSRDDRIDLAA